MLGDLSVRLNEHSSLKQTAFAPHVICNHAGLTKNGVSGTPFAKPTLDACSFNHKTNNANDNYHVHDQCCFKFHEILPLN